ncbi:MAG: hypothetical protein HUU56_15480 [Bdellovibrionaceae bacterium]|nr:hypothetical protein [Pseudobdellovibrionaceae bacterium]
MVNSGYANIPYTPIDLSGSKERFSRSHYNLPLMRFLTSNLNNPYYNYQPRRSLKIKDTRNIDQASSAECFIMAFLGMMESTFLNKHNVSMEFSPEWLVAQKLKYIIRGLFEYNEQNLFYNLKGGEFFHVLNSINSSGLIPLNANWSSLYPLAEWPMNEIYEQIKKETEPIFYELRNKDLNPKDKEVFLNKKTEKIFKKVLGPYIGMIPEKFEILGKPGISYTPVEFGEKVLIKRIKKVRAIYPSTRHNLYETKSELKYNYELPAIFENILNSPDRLETLSLAPVEFLKVIEEQLKKGQAVFFDHDIDYRNSNGHSMVVVDIEKVGDHFLSLKIKNSYSVKNDDNGYFWIRTDEFFKYLRRAWLVDWN